MPSRSTGPEYCCCSKSKGTTEVCWLSERGVGGDGDPRGARAMSHLWHVSERDRNSPFNSGTPQLPEDTTGERGDGVSRNPSNTTTATRVRRRARPAAVRAGLGKSPRGEEENA